MASKIEDYAIIGDCETAALVGRNGSIDWLCWPRFDSGTCFAALLGSQNNGRWLLRAADATARVSRHYRGRTLILETEIETSGGIATVLDFMPPRAKASDVVRLVQGKAGQVDMYTELAIRFDYGSLVPWAGRLDDGTLRMISGPDMAVLRTPASLHGDHGKTAGSFTITAGQTIPFVLTYGASYLEPPDAIDPLKALAETELFWSNWTSRALPAGRWSDAIIRSLLTLKALTHRPTGGIVAAATTSLPEQPGGTRNWDYRYCWLRDGTFTLLALMNAGYHEDARAWREWLLRAIAGDPAALQPTYGVAGERRLPEWEVPWLAGFGRASPVRVGNIAWEQVQLDVYGEVMDVLHHARIGALDAHKDGWELQQGLLDHLEKIWREPDRGIWESRDNRLQFTNSKVMAWVAFDRAVKTIEQFRLDGPVDRWRLLRKTIHAEVCKHAFNDDVGAFVQNYGSKQLDASALLIPLVGFLPPQDPRVKSTVDAIERKLVIEGLVMRNESAAENHSEGAFLSCSFWLADNLILLGRRDEARRLFEYLLSLRNDVGLLAEEYDVGEKRLVGNFPQALSHIALVNTGYELASKTKQRRHEAGRSQSDTHHPLQADATL
ncbi:MAG: glycoside hydrolase family 15 protein [Xanthobacteraceae bacterium]